MVALMVAFALLGLSGVPVGAEGDELRRMGAVDIFEALVSHDAAQRDRAVIELPLMSANTARQLGDEIRRAGVREAETCLKALAGAGCARAASVIYIAFDSEDLRVREAALDALVSMHPKHPQDGAAEGLTPARVRSLSALISEGDYMRQLCGTASRNAVDAPVTPVIEAMHLSLLLDRVLGAKAMPLLLNRIADLMLGEQHDDAQSPTLLAANESRRRGAAVWFQAVWVSDAATRFNYSATAPWTEREKAVVRLRATLRDLEKQDVELAGRNYKGVRLGDHLIELFAEDISEARAAAYLRMKWWRGDEVVIAGEGYAAEVDRINELTNRELMVLRRQLRAWWSEYRAETEPA